VKDKIFVNYGRNLFFLNFLYFFFIKKKITEIFNIFKKKVKPKINSSILDVGTTSSLSDHENVMISLYKHKNMLSLLSNLSLKNVKNKYPEVRIYKGDGRKLKFRNNSFDIVISTATIEHVGSFSNQLRFLKECYRVAKNKVFITTPNITFPIEFHTRIPFIHWLPKKIYRFILTLLKENFLNKEENLNLLTKNELVKICNKLKFKKFLFYDVKLFGINSNIILIISKKVK
jgi:ubiquinone/menaquinone biosynthesis C-methylase UbiE